MGSHSAVIVCTRNRPDDVRRLLWTLPAQTSKPHLLVCDSSSGDETRRVVEEFARAGVWPGVQYIDCEPGLTRQRMRALQALDARFEIVHFIDDDVVPEPEYFEVLERNFEALPEVLGLGGCITNPKVGRTPSLGARLFFLDSARRGIVTCAGVNTFPYLPTKPLEVEWLSGCSMSFRRSVFEHMAFDLRMIGYSLGEDVDFTFRVSRMGPLMLIPDARLAHLTSTAASASEHEKYTRDRLIFRHRFVSEMRGLGTSLPAFWWSLLGELLSALSKALRGNGSMAQAQVRGVLSAFLEIARAGFSIPKNPRVGA